MDEYRLRSLLAHRRARRGAPDVVASLTEEWFPDERAFFDDPSQLAAALCSRRAGKTRGEAKDLLRDLLTIPGYRGLYLNTTRGEGERLMWFGNRGDGIATLARALELPLKLNNSDLSAHNPATDGWVWIRGADDEAELRKALGGAYHKVYWDEFQKLPPKLGPSIREVFFPALLDFGGKFRATGTPSRQMSGLFYEITRPEAERRTKGWSVHQWTLLQNPFWGRAKQISGRWHVVWGARDEIVSGPHRVAELEAAIAAARWTKGVLALQQLYGGPEVAPIDSPIMSREAFGRWTREDTAYVYAIHKVPSSSVLYAPHRVRDDGFPDIARALQDLPFDWRQGLFAMGVDIGWYPDPFSFVLWAWHGHDPRLYEVASYRANYLDSDQQNACIKAVRELVTVGIVVADASNPAKPTVKGWSKEWIERYQQPIIEAEKAHKYGAIDTMNTDILATNVQLRDGGPLYDEMSQLQWSSVISASGRQVEDPTMANDCCDAGLYAHRHSYAFRWRPEEKKHAPGSPESVLREERELAESAEDDGEEIDSYSQYH